jgi:hypothetical protein
LDIGGGWSLLALRHLEADSFTLVEGPEPGFLDLIVVDKNVSTRISLDKSIALLTVKPFDFPCLFHTNISLKNDLVLGFMKQGEEEHNAGDLSSD